MRNKKAVTTVLVILALFITLAQWGGTSRAQIANVQPVIHSEIVLVQGTLRDVQTNANKQIGKMEPDGFRLKAVTLLATDIKTNVTIALTFEKQIDD